MEANSHPIKVQNVSGEKMFANSHPYKVAIVGGSGQEARIVEELPETGESGYVYLVLKKSKKTGDIYDEYLWALQEDGKTYGWEHIGATSEVSIKLYDTYGQNEDGAMTQKATTDLVYTAGNPKKINIGDNGVTGGTNSIIIGSEDSGSISSANDNIVIGHNATVGAGNSILIGHDVSVGTGTNGYYGNAIAIGRNASASYRFAIAIGSGVSNSVSARADLESCIAIGSNAHAKGQFGVCIGKGEAGTYGLVIGGEGDYRQPTADGGYDGQAIKIGLSGSAQGRAIAIGLDSSATTDTTVGNVAIGDSAIVNVVSGVALGSFAKPRAKGVVDVGISSNSATVYDTAGFNDTRYRVISGVHDPELAQDAATKNYVDTQVGNIETILQALNSGVGV